MENLITEQVVTFDDYKKNKEKCPSCGNKMFWEYGSTKDKLPETLKCTYCSKILEADVEKECFK